MTELIDKPGHYQLEGMEVLDVIRAAGWLKPYVKACIIKYIMRSGKKGGSPEKQDLEKACKYCDILINELNRQAELGNEPTHKIIASKGIVRDEER